MCLIGKRSYRNMYKALHITMNLMRVVLVMAFYHVYILMIWYESCAAFSTLLGLSAFDS